MTQSDFLFVLALMSVIAAAQCTSCGHSERSAYALERLAKAAEKCPETRPIAAQP
jgi:hypothetical protein